MRKHTKIYYSHFDYPLDPSFNVPCEMCGDMAVDIHHIDARGMGGSKLRDGIENLMALCRVCHDRFGDKKNFKNLLKETHIKFMQNDTTK